MFNEFFYNDNDKLLNLLYINWRFICNMSDITEPFSISSYNTKITLTIIGYYQATIQINHNLHNIKNAVNIFLGKEIIHDIYVKVDNKIMQCK